MPSRATGTATATATDAAVTAAYPTHRGPRRAPRLPSTTRRRRRHGRDADADSGSGDRRTAGQQPWRDDDGSANKRRRRRRGRDRERTPGDGRVDATRPERERRVERGDEYSGDLIEIEGLLDLRDEGYGFLRASGYLAGRNDAYVSASQVRRFGLRKGDHVKGATRPPASSEKYPALVRVDLINDVSIDEARHRVALRGPHAAVPRLAPQARARRQPRPRSPAASSTSSRRSGRVSAG